jgi:hypothetical protein
VTAYQLSSFFNPRRVNYTAMKPDAPVTRTLAPDLIAGIVDM